MTLFVRSARPQDAASVARIHVVSWRGAYRGLLPDRILDGLSVSGRERLWSQRIAAAGREQRILVGGRDAAVEGFVTLLDRARDPDEAMGVGEIPALYVAPDAWRTGIGSALVGAAVEAVSESGCHEVILWMLAGNARAAGFYRSQGFADDGGRRRSQYFPDESELSEVRFRRSL